MDRERTGTYLKVVPTKMTDAEELLEYRKQELYDLMSEISEECYCAGWMMGNEYRLWQAITDPLDDRRYGMDEIHPQQIHRLKELSEQTDGWWIWDDVVGAKFVSLPVWAAIRTQSGTS